MPQQPKRINHHAFSEYTEESAYWAGFLASDGNLRVSGKGHKCVRLYLGIKDLGHLQKFKEFLQSDHKIATPEKYLRCSMEFVSETIYDDLVEKYTLTPRKSMTYRFPEQVPEELTPHFVRGYFDGDGCVYESFMNRNSLTASYGVTMLGTEDFVRKVSEVVEPHLSRPISYKPAMHTNGLTRIFNLATVQAGEFLKWIYQCSTPSTRLDRKYALYDKICVRGERKTRELPPYDERNVCKTSRRRGRNAVESPAELAA